MRPTIEEKIDGMQSDISLIKIGLLGNKSAGIPGVVNTLEQHGVRIAKLETTNKKIKWFGMGSLFAGGLIGGYVGKGTVIKFLIGFFFCLILFIIVI